MDIRDVIEEKYINYLNCETDNLDLTIEEAKFILANDKKVHFVDDLLVEVYKVVLSELERLKKYENLEWQEFNELAVKDKIIEEMAKYIASLDTDEDICKNIQCTDGVNKFHKNCSECIKEYFTKKVEGK